MQSRHLPWKQAFDALEQSINAEGVHTYPFDLEFPIDIAFFVHACRDHVRMNRHSYLEVIYVYEGEADIQLMERHFAVQRGDLMIVGPDLYHRVVSRPNLEAKLISLNFEPEEIGIGGNGVEQEYLAPFFLPSDQLQNVVCSNPDISVRALELLLQVHEELHAQTALSRVAVNTYLRMLLLLLRRYYGGYLETREIADSRQYDLQRLAPLFNYLERRPGQPIQVADAARICAMSSSYFMSTFKKATGQSFVAYLNSFRVEKAQVLLTQSNESIAEISAGLAFCSQSYFGKVFHSLVGMTPRAYRERFGGRAAAGANSSGGVHYARDDVRSNNRAVDAQGIAARLAGHSDFRRR